MQNAIDAHETDQEFVNVFTLRTFHDAESMEDCQKTLRQLCIRDLRGCRRWQQEPGRIRRVTRLTPIRAPVGRVIAQLRPVAALQEKWPAQSCQNRVLVVRDRCSGNRRQRLVRHLSISGLIPVWRFQRRVLQLKCMYGARRHPEDFGTPRTVFGDRRGAARSCSSRLLPT